MPLKDLLIAVTLMLIFVFGFKPAVNNFKVVWNDNTNTKVTPAMRRFVLLWLGFGVVCMVLGFFMIGYSVGAKLGYLPDFKL